MRDKELIEAALERYSRSGDWGMPNSENSRVIEHLGRRYVELKENEAILIALYWFRDDGAYPPHFTRIKRLPTRHNKKPIAKDDTSRVVLASEPGPKFDAAEIARRCGF